MEVQKLIVKKTGSLWGKVRVDGAKNSALPILAAGILANSPCTIDDVPLLSDVEDMCSLLRHLGYAVDRIENQITLSPSGDPRFDAPYELVNKFRASFLISGALLARWGKAKISLPGGCPIGSRPVDLHLKGLSAMGAQIRQENGYIELSAQQLHGTKIYLDFPSVGATENILIAACMADGQTIIENAAVEPEVTDLANFLVEMGADIRGAGTDSIKVTGVTSLSGANHIIIPDRIEAGTFMTAVAATGGRVTLENVMPGHLKPIIAKLREIGVVITEENDCLTIVADTHLHSSNIKTLPFPGFPTDMQAQFAALMSVTEGTSVIIETIFENRFMHMGELMRMGAEIKTEGRTAIIEGVSTLSGSKVRATDLRAGAAMIIAGLCAEGETEIEDIEHVDRGYCRIEEKFQQLGADIERRPAT